MKLYGKQVWQKCLVLGLSGALIVTGSFYLKGTAVSADIDDDFYDEVWEDDSDLQLDDEVGDDNPTWEDYQQGATLEEEEESEESEKTDEEDTGDIPQLGEQYTSSKASYVVTRSDAAKGTVEYSSPIGTAASVIIPKTVTIDGISFKVTSIAKSAFKNNKKIQSVSIGGNVTQISANAFRGCTKLKKVTMGAQVKEFGANAFRNCTALTKIVIPSKTTKIGVRALSGCKKITQITVKSTGLKQANIGNYAFTGISGKAAVKVPKAKKKAYQKIFVKKGLSSKVKFK